MARKHVFILVVILGAAALSGLVAMARTTGVGAPAKAAPAAASPALDARLQQLTRFEKRLKKELAKKPAKHAAAPRHAAVATSSSAGQSGTIFVPAASTSVQSSHSSFSDDDEHEEEHETKAAMTNHIARLYAAAGAILALFLAWAGIAAHPWQSDQKTPVNARADSEARALAAYEKRLKKDARLVRKVVRRRAAEARAARQAAALRLPPPRPAPRLRAGLPPHRFES